MPNVPSLVGSSGNGSLSLSGETCWREANCSVSLSLFPSTLGRDFEREDPCKLLLYGAVLGYVRFKSKVWRCGKSSSQVFTSVMSVGFLRVVESGIYYLLLTLVEVQDCCL